MQSFSFYDYSIGNARQLGMKCIEKNYCCPLKMMEMKNEWDLLFEKRIRNACQLHYTCLSVPLRLIATNVLVPFSDIHIAYLSHKVTKKHKKTLGLVRNVKAKGKCLNLG